MAGWGKVLVGTRLEKQVSARFFQVWEQIVTRGLSAGDASLSVRGHVAHRAANRLVREFLVTECDSLLFLDSDAIVPHDIIEQFRRYEPGYAYDALQAFYCRRGWPPTPIWLKRDATGAMMDSYVVQDNAVEEVDVVGLHCTIIRRRVFEVMLGGADPETFDWFFYDRHNNATEDSCFSLEAQRHGFRLGATTAIKTGHLGDLETNWDSYLDWMQSSGQLDLLTRRVELAHEIAAFTREPVEMVLSWASSGAQLVANAWQRHNPQTADEVRAFYGHDDNGCLYDLLWWNCSEEFERAIAPLRAARDRRALVVGPGLGTEVQVLMAGDNKVDVWELPGVLADFLRARFGDQIGWPGMWTWSGSYDLVSAIDVIEHVHPDELQAVLRQINAVLKPGGTLVMHLAGAGPRQPQHFDHSQAVAGWLDAHFERIDGYSWRKRDAK